MAGDDSEGDRRTRVGAMVEAMQARRVGAAMRYAMLALGLALTAALRSPAWIVLFFPVYLAAEVGSNAYLRRVAARPEIGRRAFGTLLASHWLRVGLFGALAVHLAMLDAVITTVAAIMLLLTLALHSVAVNAPSWDCARADVAVVALSLQAVAWSGAGWATPTEAAFLHVTCFLVVVFFWQTARHAHRLTTKLRTTSTRLLRAHRSGVMNELASGIAHDFNNLLTVMTGNLDLLKEVPDAERPALLREIETAAKRGGQLVARLSRSGREEAAAGPSPLAPVIERFERMARSTLPANVRLTVDLRDAPETVAVDPAQLELALLNLAVNARDALSSGGSILVRAVADAHPPRLRLTVTDDGEGMAPEVLERATEPYETTKPPGKGTGLGLAMVKSFVEDAGGTLRIESARGAGTKVELVLPVEQAVVARRDRA